MCRMTWNGGYRGGATIANLSFNQEDLMEGGIILKKPCYFSKFLGPVLQSI